MRRSKEEKIQTQKEAMHIQYNRSALYKLAYDLWVDCEEIETFGQAVKKVHEARRTKNEMKAKKVGFVFIKKDGSQRLAIGTLNPNYFSHFKPKQPKRQPCLYCVKYWDVEKDAPRMFRIDRIQLSAA